MSTSYVGRAVMERVKDSQPDYQIRRVALHARNPISDPKPFEMNLIDFFATIPRYGAGKASSRLPASPVSSIPARSFSPPDCMHCHGKPKDVPPDLLKLYGRDRGFGYKPGDIAGVTAVSIPVDVALAKIKERAISSSASVSLAFPCSIWASVSFSTGWSFTA